MQSTRDRSGRPWRAGAAGTGIEHRAPPQIACCAIRTGSPTVPQPNGAGPAA